MAETQEVRCTERCRDNATMRRYFPGDIDDIDPSLPIAMYFEGWKDGTKVYHKVRGTKDRDIKVTTRTIGKAPGKAPGGPCRAFTARSGAEGQDRHRCSLAGAHRHRHGACRGR